MPVPLNDVAASMRISVERTETAVQKVGMYQ